jgi:hypothetical protein
MFVIAARTTSSQHVRETVGPYTMTVLRAFSMLSLLTAPSLVLYEAAATAHGTPYRTCTWSHGRATVVHGRAGTRVTMLINSRCG